MDCYYYENHGGKVQFCEGRGDTCVWGDAFLYGDPFYNLTYGEKACYGVLRQRYRQAAKILCGKERGELPLAYVLFCILEKKVFLYEHLRDAYQKRDQSGLIRCAAVLTELVACYEQLLPLFERRWMTYYKPFGYEAALMKLGGVTERCRYARRTLEAYLSGERSAVAELEPEPLPCRLPETFLQAVTPTTMF